MSENKGRAELDIDLLDDEDDEDAQKDKYLTFHLAKEDYAVEIRHVMEIIGIQRITEVPDMPDFVKGVINLRGKIIPVIDVRIRFKFEPKEYDDRTCIIVVNMNDSTVGLVVDEVSEVVDIPADQVEPPPTAAAGGKGRYLQGMGKMGDEVKIILNVGKLLCDDDMATLKDSAASVDDPAEAGASA